MRKIMSIAEKVAENLQGLQFVIITIVVVMNMCTVHQIHQRAVTDARKNFRRQGGRGLLGAEVLLLLCYHCYYK